MLKYRLVWKQSMVVLLPVEQYIYYKKVSPFFPTWAHLDPFIKDYG